MEKDWPKRPSDGQLQEAQKRTDRAITPAAEAVCVPTWRCWDPHDPAAVPASRSTLTGAELHGRKSCVHARGATSACVALCNPLDCDLPGFCVSGLLQARLLQRIGRYWLPCGPRAPYFLLPELPTPLSTWCCQNPCDPSSPTTSTPGPLRGKPKSSRAASGANPVDDPHAEVEIEPRLKLRGSVAKEEDPNLPTSCTSGRLNPQDQLRRLCVHGDVRGR